MITAKTIYEQKESEGNDVGGDDEDEGGGDDDNTQADAIPVSRDEGGYDEEQDDSNVNYDRQVEEYSITIQAA
jgi:hypothetical protein